MNKIYVRTLMAVILLLAACEKDLDQFPNKETSSENVYVDAKGYKSVLAKLYVSFVTQGQEQGGGNEDLSSNRGEDYMRCYFNLQECGTDEIAYTYTEGDQTAGLTYLSWDANDPWVADMYYRIYYTISLCNEFLRNATDDKISDFDENEQSEIKNYRAEARFIRALCYYHALDLYRNVPFVTENDLVGAYAPPRYSSSQLFAYLENELKDIEDRLLSKNEQEYGRAPKAAARTLLAKLYLNAPIYTGKEHYTDCITYCKKVIAAGYTLEPEYQKLFNADNHLRTNEIIFALPVDADHTVSWGSTTYIICGAVSNASDYQNPADYGVTDAWGIFRLKGELTTLYSENDARKLIFTEGQSQYVDDIANQSQGYLSTKWTNLDDVGRVPATNNTVAGGASTDFPLFRLADVYLMLAESVIRGGSGSSNAEALQLINSLRARAYGEHYEAEGKLSDAELTLNLMLEERARELSLECTRRTDLIRFGKFTTGDYLWQWKGGEKDGKAVDSKYNYYPIPSTDLTANPNLSNPEY